MDKYQVKRDTREQEEHGWMFPESDTCLGTLTETLATADYTLAGYEKLFVIERKGSPAEFCQNIVQDRFDRELKRLEEFTHPFIICEFDMWHIQNFPKKSGIPERLWPKLRITPQYFLLRFWEIQLQYKVRIILAGADGGRNAASSLFKRIIKNAHP